MGLGRLLGGESVFEARLMLKGSHRRWGGGGEGLDCSPVARVESFGATKATASKRQRGLSRAFKTKRFVWSGWFTPPKQKFESPPHHHVFQKKSIAIAQCT